MERLIDEIHSTAELQLAMEVALAAVKAHRAAVENEAWTVEEDPEIGNVPDYEGAIEL